MCAAKRSKFIKHAGGQQFKKRRSDLLYWASVESLAEDYRRTDDLKAVKAELAHAPLDTSFNAQIKA